MRAVSAESHELDSEFSMELAQEMVGLYLIQPNCF